ncbi:MAG: hypothetical protein IT449_04565 [Phycisphaerales bacterium]|nr:hypothetical protein [Phycisphaerales bacterium]
MPKQFRIGHASLLIAIGLAACGMPFGCDEKKDKPNVVPLTGKVIAVDLKKNDITVEYQLPKRQDKAVDTAKVTEATEIQINGVVGKLSDIKVGEHIRGDVLVEGKGESRVLTVLRIYVDRAAP